MGPDLMLAMRRQAVRFGTRILTDDIVSVELTEPVKTVIDGEGTEHRAHAVILAMGSAYRELGLPDEKRLSGRGVSWCATCDGFFFRGQDIGVVGGGDSAIEWALFLTKFARTVTIIHRREQLRAWQDHGRTGVRQRQGSPSGGTATCWASTATTSSPG